MDYPQGRHNHHHGGDDRRYEEDQYGHPQPRPPITYNIRPHPHPPPPQVYHTSHMGPPGPEAYPSPPPPAFPNYHPSPPPPQVYHTSHTGPEYYPPPPPVTNYHPSPPPPVHTDHHHHHPHAPHFPPAADHRPENELRDKPSFRMYSKAEPNYSLTIRDGNVVLTRHDPTDPCQHWVKDLKFSTRVKDEEGFPSFALVNKATGQAIKHSIGATHPVQLTPYNSNSLDESILWTESRDLGDTYRTIRMVNNIKLNIDAFNGDKNHGGVRDGTKIVLWEWKKGENQCWKIVPHCKCMIRYVK